MIRTKANYLILVLILIYCGCSANNAGVTPENIANLPYSKELQRGANWTWDVGLYQVSDDHSAIEKLPWRESDYHINVNRFIEPPSCNNCLKIWNLKHQPDGTLKLTLLCAIHSPTRRNIRGLTSGEPLYSRPQDIGSGNRWIFAQETR